MLRSEIDANAFENAKEKIVGKFHNDKGIGTLKEKSIHGILKYYYEPNDDYHEVALDGYFADIYVPDEGIIEIQTRQFNKLRGKLEAFLENYDVTVVYPMPYNKWVVWIDPTTGEEGKPHKAPKCWTPYEVFVELYRIKMFLNNPRLHFRIAMMDMVEYKILDGWNYSKKRGATKIDRIPKQLVKEVSVDRKEDYMQFVPFDLGNEFSVADFAKAAKISKSLAGMVLNILYSVGTVERTGKKGNAYIYSVND